MQGLLEAVGMEYLEENLKYLGSMFAANDQGTEEIGSRINLAHSAFCSPAFGRDVKYRYVHRIGSTRQ